MDSWKANTLNVQTGAVASTSMRYHELALQLWLNRIFLVRWGYPVPVVFSAPMDAFATINQLWKEPNNPFQYLLDAKDADGKPLYQPYPQPVRYPIISVNRKSWKLRQAQNFSIHRMRHINWPTVSSTGTAVYGVNSTGTNLHLGDLGNVTTSRFPLALDYRFQIDHFCNRPDSQAFFISQIFRELGRACGSQLHTWIKVPYPGFGDKLVRLALDGEVSNLTPEEPEAGRNVEFRTSFTVIIEGYDIDLNYDIYPTLWKVLVGQPNASPDDVQIAFTTDGRLQPENTVVTYAQKTSNMPPP